MRFFISAIPIFDADMAVHAYIMMTKDGDKLLGAAEDFRELSGELLAPALEYVKDIGIEPFAMDKDFFVNISKYQLLMGIPLTWRIPPDNLVCVIDQDALEDNAALIKIGILKRNKYRLALMGVPTKLSLDTAIKLFDFFLLSCESEKYNDDWRVLQQQLHRTSVIVTEVPDRETYESLNKASGVLFSGNFYSQPITKGLTEISPLKINALQLIKQINEEGFDLVEAAKTIERDPALSISLLRFLNSINPNRSKKIDSIRSAVALLGQKEVKKWATVAISVGIGEDRPSEITRLSLLRAKCAENLAPHFEMAMKEGALFIAGLFSLLDVILERPMAEALDEVAANDEIRTALVEKKGPIYEVLSLIYAYEKADWYNASIIKVRNGIDIEQLTNAFIDALMWYKQLLDMIDADEESESTHEGDDENSVDQAESAAGGTS